MLINKNKKNLIIGMPTVGKTTFYKTNKDISWDSDFFYKLISSINDKHIDTFKNENILFKEIFPFINKHLIKSNKNIILHSIIGLEYIDIYKYFIKNNYKIFFIIREINDYLKMWDKRHLENKNTIYRPNEKDAKGCIKIIKEISKIIDCEIIVLKQNEFLSDLIK